MNTKKVKFYKSPNDFKKCCAKHMKEIWDEAGGSENILHRTTVCPKCNHFIGLTCTPTDEANEFLNKFGLRMEDRSEYITIKAEPYDGKTTPKYYKGKHYGYTAEKVVQDFELGYNIGTAVTYLLRAGKKPDNPMLQDLKKALHHLNMEIEHLKKTTS